MLAKLNTEERNEIQAILARIANDANVMADKLDTKRESKRRDGKRYEMARHFDAIYNLAKAAQLKLGS